MDAMENAFVINHTPIRIQKYLFNIAGIPIGAATAFSDYDGMREAGYALMGAGTAELIECVKNRKRKGERAELMKEIKRLRKEVRQLEEEEMGLLSRRSKNKAVAAA